MTKFDFSRLAVKNFQNFYQKDLHYCIQIFISNQPLSVPKSKLMPGTFSQIYIQVVFAIKGRQSLILPSWESQLYRYITGVVQNKDQKMLAINGMPDHIHFLFGMRPTCNISNLVQELKKASNQSINEKN